MKPTSREVAKSLAIAYLFVLIILYTIVKLSECTKNSDRLLPATYYFKSI
ncbi:MAG: hypothetical protein F6K39_01455 [Okeania sp. SIO3B3]|nr:hypothetical protein [Okeania sp. SIO3B3]